MELLFNEREKSAVMEKYNISLQEYVDKLIFLEELNEDNVYELFESRVGFVGHYIEQKIKTESRPYLSLLYYFQKCRKMLNARNDITRDAKGKQDSSSPSDFLRATKMLLCSSYNYLCYLSEEATHVDNSKTIVIFEACPLDLKKIRSREEARILKDIANKANVNAVVMFNTNTNIFKDTCNNYKIDYFHFVGHGEVDGDIQLVNNSGKASILSFKTFESYFDGEYKTKHPGSKVESCYINSCYSETYISKIAWSPLISDLFGYRIGHHGSNNDNFALESAAKIYEGIFADGKSILGSFNDVKHEFKDPVNCFNKITYARDMVIF